jgi:hypothetical protein
VLDNFSFLRRPHGWPCGFLWRGHEFRRSMPRMESAIEKPRQAAGVQQRNGASTGLPRRSKTRQGKARLLSRDQLDQRTAVAKSFDKLASEISADLGGLSELTAIEKALIEGFCGAAVVLQSLNTKLALGEAIDLAQHAAVCSSLVRIASKIGLSRRSRVVSGIVEAGAEPLPWSPLRSQLAAELEQTNKQTNEQINGKTNGHEAIG